MYIHILSFYALTVACVLSFKLQIISMTIRIMIRKECAYGRHRAKKKNVTKKKPNTTSTTHAQQQTEITATWKKCGKFIALLSSISYLSKCMKDA